jgi:hypothetical protein
MGTTNLYFTFQELRLELAKRDVPLLPTELNIG